MGFLVLYMRNRNCTNRLVGLVSECFPDHTLETGAREELCVFPISPMALLDDLVGETLAGTGEVVVRAPRGRLRWLPDLAPDFPLASTLGPGLEEEEESEKEWTGFLAKENRDRDLKREP